MKGIVVGVDGSPGSVAALRAAIEEARLRGCALNVVSVWHVPPAAYDSGLVPIPVEPPEYEKLGAAALEQALSAVGPLPDGAELTTAVREGQASDVLVAESQDAQLLVVGSRGLGGFRGLLLGSVSQQCAQHASCPVMIVPHAHPE